MDNVELLREVHAPFERGEAEDYQPIWDIVAEDVVYDSPVGRLVGRDTMIAYFTNVAEIVEFSPFEGPIGYFGAGDQVVMTCEEHIRNLHDGATTKGEWVWLIDMREGKMTRIVHFLHFEDLPVLVEPLKEAYARTTTAPAAS